MEKVALVEIGTSNIRLSIYKVREGENFTLYKQITEKIDLGENIKEDGIITNAKIKECIALVQILKKICEAEGVSRYIAEASNAIDIATNYQSFVNEIGTAMGVDFRILSPQDEISSIYTAVTNTLDIAKGVIVNISSHTTRLIHYNRRIVLDSISLPYGTETSGEVCLNFREILKNANLPFINNIDPETVLVGVGEVFSAFGKISRRLDRYSLDIDHGYTTTKASFDKAREFINTLPPEKKQKLKGISDSSVNCIQNGMCIASAILEFTEMNDIVVSGAFRNTGVMFKYTLPYTMERPVNDVLGYSLEKIAANMGISNRRSEKLYDLALVLFKQFKVLHKLPRNYAKVLRVAAYMSNAEEDAKFHMTLRAPLLGLTQKEILLAAFVVQSRNWDDFNLSEWIRHKDLLTDSDLDSVRKLASILAISEALNIRNQEIIKDVHCDILGESVILKLISEGEPKTATGSQNAVGVEAYYTRRQSGQFGRAFNKVLEIL